MAVREKSPLLSESEEHGGNWGRCVCVVYNSGLKLLTGSLIGCVVVV